MAEIKELAERVRQATGPDRDLNADLLQAFGWRQEAGRVVGPDGALCFQVPDFTASLDASLALVERVLPGFWWCSRSDEAQGFYGALGPIGEPPTPKFHAYAPTPALALLSALLAALDTGGADA